MYQSRRGSSRELPRLQEPGMLIGGVVRNQIEDELEPALMRRLHQRVEILHGPEQGIDAGVIGDVIAEIDHRRGEDRRQPDRIDAERQQIGQPVDDPGEIADAIAITVLERARIDLIENAFAPPGFVVDSSETTVLLKLTAAVQRGSRRQVQL